MVDVFDSRGEDDAFAARPGADIVVERGGVEDAPRRDAADGGSAPGRGRGYVVEDVAGLDWLFGGVISDDFVSLRALDLPDHGGAGVDVEPVFIGSRRHRRRQGRRA